MKQSLPKVRRTDKDVTTLPNTPGRQAAQARYNSQPEQIKRREQRNKARRIEEAKGLVKKGDGKDVDHKNHNTSDESASNLRVESASKNRSTNRRFPSGKLVKLKKS